MKMQFQVLIFSLFFSFTFGYNIYERNCPTGTWSSFTGDKCWMFVTIPYNFIEAAQYCRSYNGNLTSIHDAFDNIYLADKAREFFTEADLYYLGGSNLYDRRQWMWVDGTPMDFTDWANYEPIDADVHNCLVVSVSYGLWHTHDCTMKSPFVCDVPQGQLTTTTMRIPDTTTIRPSPSMLPLTTTMRPFFQTTQASTTIKVISNPTPRATATPTPIMTSKISPAVASSMTTATVTVPPAPTLQTRRTKTNSFSNTATNNDGTSTAQRGSRESSTPLISSRANVNPFFNSLLTSLAVGKAAEYFPNMNILRQNIANSKESRLKLSHRKH